ncbi:glycosyltransferase [Psychromonas hadalis]|uniref:glycosyltransferase n=1 Tax=Psychromonas hadalis TaxID=211669 RepID=UPI0003B495FC|nr:glycosyltransferase [Psychromonas hadalis]
MVATSKWMSYLKLIERCAEQGWNNWLILSKQPEDQSLIEPFLKVGCKIIYQPRSKGNFDLQSIHRNYKLLRSIQCDIFHCYNDHTSPLIAAKLAGVPVKLWSKLSMSSYYELSTRPSGLQKLMLSSRITGWCVDRILAVSDLAGKEVIEQVGFKDKVTTVTVPVSVERFVSIKHSQVRKEFNLKKSDVVIVAVGHFVEIKGWDIAIDAFALVNKNVPDAKLLLVGKKTSERFYQKVIKKIDEYGLSKHVIILGGRSDIPEILKASDLFILPSLSEGTPAALVEAMAVGIPCIATATGGMPEVIENGVNGFLFQRENADELAEKIIYVVSHPELRMKIVDEGRKGLQRYSMKTYVETVFSHYQNLLDSSQ